MGGSTMKQRYDSYKPSGIDWIGEIPSHWTVMPVKYVLDNLDYLRQPISAEDRERNNPKYDYYGASGVIDQIDFYNVDDTVLLIGEDGANLVMRNLPLIYRASGKFWVNNHAHILKPKNGHNYYYLAHLLEAGDYTLFITGSAQPKLSQENLNKYPICIPPLAEQEAIAAWLDEKCGEIDAAIAKVDREIELIDELKQSEISRVVTRGLNPNASLRPSGIDWIGDIPKHWKISPIKHICRSEKYSIKTGPFGSQLKGEDLKEEGDVRVYNQRNVIDNNFYEVANYVIAEKAKDLESFYTLPNDILVTSRGTIGKSAILPDDVDMGILHPCLIALRIDESKANLNWIQRWINESDAFGRDIEVKSNATTIDVIYTETIKNVRIALPPLSEQQAIADYLDKKCAEIDGLKTKLSKMRETLTELRQSIISEVVTGKRRVAACRDRIDRDHIICEIDNNGRDRSRPYNNGRDRS